MKFTQAILKKNGLLKKIPRSKYFVIQDEFVWYIDYDTKNTYVIINKGFRTDFGSIPRIFQNIFQPTKYISFVLHDFLYSKNGKILDNIDGANIEYTRYDADMILIEALRVEGSTVLNRIFIFLGIRLFGFLFYKK